MPDSKLTMLYEATEFLWRLVAVNLLWLVCSLPVITFFPATAAMYDVIDQGHRGKITNVWSPFWSAFRQHFRRSLWAGAAYTLIMLALLADIVLLCHQANTILKFAGYLLVSAALILFIGGFYIIPLTVRTDRKVPSILRDAVLVGAGHLFSSLYLLFLTLASFFIVIKFPELFPFLSGSLPTYAIVRRFNRIVHMHQLKTRHEIAIPDIFLSTGRR